MSTSINRLQVVSPKWLLAALTTGHMVNDFYALVLPFLLPTLIIVFELDFFRAGLLGMATTFLPGILQPVLGYLADRHARRKAVMLFGFATFIVGLFIVGIAPTYLVVLLGFLVFGIGMGTFHAQSTNFITHTFGNAKGRAMGIHGIGGSIGNFTVPILVSFLLTFISWRSTVFALIGPAAVVIILLYLFLPELQVPGSNLSPWQVKLDRDIWVLALCLGFMSMMYRSVLTFLPTYLIEQGAALREAGVISTLMLFVGFLAQPLGGYAFDRVGGRVLYAICAILAGIFLLLFTTGVGPYPFVFVILFGASILTLFPVSLAMGGELAKGEMVGLKVGFNFGLSALMSSLTPPLTGYLADAFSLQRALQFLAIFAVLLFITALMLPKRTADS